MTYASKLYSDLHKCSVKEAPPKKELVVVDALCYLNRIMISESDPQFEHAIPSVLLEAARTKIVRLSDAARRADMTLVWVFGDESASPTCSEALAQQRTDEVLSGSKQVPLHFDIFFQSLLIEEGFAVLSPPGLTGAEACAALAFRFGAHVLSDCASMCAYFDDDESGKPPFLVSWDFGIDSRTRRLVLALGWSGMEEGENREPVNVRRLAEEHLPQPKFASFESAIAAWQRRSPCLYSSLQDGVVRAGNACCNTYTLGNAHALVAPLLSGLLSTMETHDSPSHVSLVAPEAVHDSIGQCVDAQFAEYRIISNSGWTDSVSTPHKALAFLKSETTSSLIPTEEMGFSRAQVVSRSHALCALAAEVAECAQYIQHKHELDNDPYYCSQSRVCQMYTRLSNAEMLLQPKSNAESGVLSQEGLQMDWAEVGKCSRLEKGVCACLGTGIPAVVFAYGMRHAQSVGKEPICMHCVLSFTRRKKKRIKQ